MSHHAVLRAWISLVDKRHIGEIACYTSVLICNGGFINVKNDQDMHDNDL